MQTLSLKIVNESDAQKFDAALSEAVETSTDMVVVSTTLRDTHTIKRISTDCWQVVARIRKQFIEGDCCV